MNATIVNTIGENHTAQEDLRSVQIARVQISTDIPTTREEKERETAAVCMEIGAKREK